MWKVSVFITVCCLLGAVFAASIDCNIDECRKPMKIYEELRCKPIYGSKSCCPKRYECPDDLKIVKDENKCIFEGKEYNVGDVLPRNSTNESKCLEACVCSRYEDEPAMFLCTNSDCGISSFKVPGCINIYGDLNECCSTSIVCDDEEKENLNTCWDSDIEYHEGEKFISKSNPCYECLCHKDFDNSTIIEENSHCHKLNCEIELKYKSFIQRGCLPIFENDKCCPVDWKCFDSSKKNKKLAKRSIDNDSEEHADFSSESYSEEDSSEHDEITTEAVKIETTTRTDAVKVTPLEVTRLIPPFEDHTVPSSIEKDEEKNDKKVPELETSHLVPPLETVTTQKSTEDEEIAEAITESSLKSIDDTTLVENIEEITTISATEPSTTESTTVKVEVTETVTKKLDKNDSSEESSSEEDDSEEKEENIFGDVVNKSKEEKDNTKPIEEVSIPIESTSESTTEVQSTLSTAEDESQKSLDQPEEITTSMPEFMSTVSIQHDEVQKSTESTPEEIKTEPATQTVPTEPTIAKIEEPKIEIPKPTQIDMILTTLKELKDYVSKLDLLSTTKASETAPPASFVNFTVSRTLPITEKIGLETEDGAEGEKTIKKRSADLKSYYNKYSNKDKGCTVGTHSYKIGEEIKTDDTCLECFCNYSPIGHCLRKEKCSST